MADQENLRKWDDACPDLMERMLLLLPLEPLLKFKFTSATWHARVSAFRLRYAPVTDTGLVVRLCHSYQENRNHQSHESIFLPPTEGQEPSTITGYRPVGACFLRASCNGFLLYNCKGYENESYDYILDIFQRRVVAELPKPHEWSHYYCSEVGLVHEGVGSNFQVLYFYYKETDENDMMKCEIYSSDTGEWSSFRARIDDFGLALGEEGAFNRDMWFGTSLYHDGRLYWIWNNCMLRYDLLSRTFKIIPLPQESNGHYWTRFFSQLLYESEGKIHFCYQSHDTEDSLRVFALVVRDDGRSDWQRRWTVSRERCTNPEWSGRWFEFRPVAFNQDLQQLILVVPPRRIISYSLETGGFAEVWTCEEAKGYETAVMEVVPVLFRSETSPKILWKKI